VKCERDGGRRLLLRDGLDRHDGGQQIAARVEEPGPRGGGDHVEGRCRLGQLAAKRCAARPPRVLDVGQGEVHVPRL
jgi:hypothetical protein